MLTPVFELSQDDNFLTIIIKAPFTKISETEVFVDGTEFKFYSKPYYLRLNLPGEIHENGQEKAQYNADAGVFTLIFPKLTKGEKFHGLDMLTKLLAPSSVKSKQPLIETIDELTNQDREDEITDDQDEEEDFDWQIEQEPYSEQAGNIQIEAPSYGFGNQRSGVFQRIQNEIHDIIDLDDADQTPNVQRRPRRLTAEQQQFDADYYLSDLYQNDMIPELLAYQPAWEKEYKEITGGAKAEEIVKFTDDEKEQLRKLPRKEYILDNEATRQALLGLVDLIFAYCYNHRTTEGENNVESGWTICKLSATLTWLETFSSVKDVCVTCCRRSVCYPLYRCWKITQQVLKDTQKILTIGVQRILKCLLEIQKLLLHSESKYILNDLYITDYCVWIQSVRTRQLESLARNLRKVKVSRGDVELDLDIIEEASRLAISEEEQANHVTEQMEHMNIYNNHTQSDVDSDVNRLLIEKSPEQKDDSHALSTSDITESSSENESESDSSTEYTTDSETESVESKDESVDAKCEALVDICESLDIKCESIGDHYESINAKCEIVDAVCESIDAKSESVESKCVSIEAKCEFMDDPIQVMKDNSTLNF